MPVAASVIRSPLKTILVAIKARLVSQLSLDPSRVLFTARKKLPKFMGDKDIVLRPMPPSALEGAQCGHGRTWDTVRRILQVIPRTRLGTDLSDRDDNWLMDTDLGHLATEEAILDALELWMPLSGQNQLLHEDMRLVSGDGPEREFSGPELQDGLTIFAFEIKYALSLTQ